MKIQFPVSPKHAIGFTHQSVKLNSKHFDLNRNHFQDNTCTSSATFSMIISLFRKHFSFLAFQFPNTPNTRKPNHTNTQRKNPPVTYQTSKLFKVKMTFLLKYRRYPKPVTQPKPHTWKQRTLKKQMWYRFITSAFSHTLNRYLIENSSFGKIIPCCYTILE